MTNAAAQSATGPRKRGKGRPAPDNDVGRERLLDAAEQLLRTMSPARVSMARVAHAAHVDPELVRYYFGNRITLLIAVIERVTSHEVRGVPRKGAPVAALADHIAKTVEFNCATPFMHRLVIDELTQPGAEKALQRIQEMNLELVEFYREVLDDDNGRELIPVDPLFLHLAVLGACDFFASADSFISAVAPEEIGTDALRESFRAFLINLILDGLRKR